MQLATCGWLEPQGGGPVDATPQARPGLIC
eukprot:SAG11_NODE_19444_length_466_cov_1.136240_1_plen_29_part_01